MNLDRLSPRTNRRSNLSIGMLAVVVLMAVAPAAASAESFCGQARSIAFTLPAPASFSEPGLHRFEWRETYVDENGVPQEGTFMNQVATVPGTSLYTGDALLRLTSVWGLSADGELVSDVQTVDPRQRMRFFASVGFFKDDPSGGQNALWVRWETPSGWTEWVAVPRGPDIAFCASFRADIVRKAYGWAH